jgi:hypothetical protein
MVCGQLGDPCHCAVQHVEAVWASDVVLVTIQLRVMEDRHVMVQQMRKLPVTIIHAQVFDLSILSTGRHIYNLMFMQHAFLLLEILGFLCHPKNLSVTLMFKCHKILKRQRK